MGRRALLLLLPPVLAALGCLVGSGTGEWGRGRGAVEGTAAEGVAGWAALQGAGGELGAPSLLCATPPTLCCAVTFHRGG